MFKNLKQVFKSEDNNIHPKVREYFASIGKKGGSASSDAKRIACIANGKKGGRPKKENQNSY
jgi:general stress protein YciG